MIFPPDIRYDDTDDDYERKMVDIWDLKICGERVLPRNFPRDLYYITPRGHFLSRNGRLDPVTGRKSLKRQGKRANGSGNVEKGYWFGTASRTGFKLKSFLLHHLVYAAFGSLAWDTGKIDHVDENKDNNHVKNLRPCTCQTNSGFHQMYEHTPVSRGGRRRKNNTTGETGVGRFSDQKKGYPTYLMKEGALVHYKCLTEKEGYTDDEAGLKKAIRFMKNIRVEYLGISQSEDEDEASGGDSGGGHDGGDSSSSSSSEPSPEEEDEDEEEEEEEDISEQLRNSDSDSEQEQEKDESYSQPETILSESGGVRRRLMRARTRKYTRPLEEDHDLNRDRSRATELERDTCEDRILPFDIGTEVNQTVWVQGKGMMDLCGKVVEVWFDQTFSLEHPDGQRVWTVEWKHDHLYEVEGYTEEELKKKAVNGEGGGDETEVGESNREEEEEEVKMEGFRKRGKKRRRTFITKMNDRVMEREQEERKIERELQLRILEEIMKGRKKNGLPTPSELALRTRWCGTRLVLASVDPEPRWCGTRFRLASVDPEPDLLIRDARKKTDVLDRVMREREEKEQEECYPSNSPSYQSPVKLPTPRRLWGSGGGHNRNDTERDQQREDQIQDQQEVKMEGLKRGDNRNDTERDQQREDQIQDQQEVKMEGLKRGKKRRRTFITKMNDREMESSGGAWKLIQKKTSEMDVTMENLLSSLNSRLGDGFGDSPDSLPESSSDLSAVLSSRSSMMCQSRYI